MMLKKLTYSVTLLAIIGTVGAGIYAMGETFKLSGIFILIMVILPYVLGLWVLSRVKTQKGVRLLSVVLILLSLIGSAMLYDALFLHPDAQAGLVFFVLPVFQLPIVLISGALAFLMQKRESSIS